MKRTCHPIKSSFWENPFSTDDYEDDNGADDDDDFTLE